MSDCLPSSSSDEIGASLRVILPEVREAYGVRGLSVFGSRARDDAKPDSDVDIVVEFDRPPGFFGFIELEEMLGARLGLRVDLVMKTALRPRLGQRILAESIAV